MRISDWSSDVCSSDLTTIGVQGIVAPFGVGQLFYNGIFQNPAAYSISGGVLTFTEALPVAGIVTIIAVFRSADQITDSDQLFTKIEERRVGKECVSPCRSRCSPYL